MIYVFYHGLKNGLAALIVEQILKIDILNTILQGLLNYC